MTLNRKLILGILTDVERRAAVAEPITVEVDDYAPAVVSEHIHLAVEAGWIEARRAEADGSWLVSRLTYQGHQELARLRAAGRPFILERG